MAAAFFIVVVVVYAASTLCAAAPGDKAKQKCEEYAKAVYAEVDSPVLLPNAGKNNESQCGRVETPLIIGGVEAGPKEFPHMAAIGYGPKENIKWMCGGSLISEDYVMTAAHCMTHKVEGDARWVRLGDSSLDGSNSDSNPQLIEVTDRKPNPNFKAPKKYDDIALLKLGKKVKFDAYSRPACLNTDKNVKGKDAIATGFGTIDFATEQTSKKLLKVKLNFIDEKPCTDAFDSDKGGMHLPNGVDFTKMLCAGDMKGGKDTCQGDSGGPLQVPLEKPYCMYSIVAVTSFGKFCGFENSPAIYSRVSNYIPWIESVVWPSPISVNQLLSDGHAHGGCDDDAGADGLAGAGPRRRRRRCDVRGERAGLRDQGRLPRDLQLQDDVPWGSEEADGGSRRHPVSLRLLLVQALLSSAARQRYTRLLRSFILHHEGRPPRSLQAKSSLPRRSEEVEERRRRHDVSKKPVSVVQSLLPALKGSVKPSLTDTLLGR